MVVSTLDPASRKSICLTGTCVDTLSGSVDTLWLKSQHLIYLDMWPLGIQGNLPSFLYPRTPRLLMDIWGYKYPCFLYSKALLRKTKLRAFWKKGRRAGKRDLHPEEQSSAAKGRRRRRREGARDCSSAGQEGDPAESEIHLSDWDSVSTQSVVVSTLDLASRRPFLHKWDSVSTHSVVVSTHSG
ncbi:hypothetical protein Taro_032763 [Colocasia esculenta]|uniref:Uncharacterized protein n=1 Tax=Colocasia esculenta TaxID=4460 RepID=A0A843VM47_COLES|nr:hypothetical protein [Colocasia esculenta]